MVSSALQIVGLVLGVIGLVGTCAVTGLPQWRVTAFIGDNLVVFENRWEGLWMNCVRQVNIRMQCKIYDSLLALPPELQASRALMCVAVALQFLTIFLAAAGMKCTRSQFGSERAKSRILIAAGVMFIFGGILVLIPVSWVANAIIRNFYNPLVPNAQKHEIGEALFIGWATAGSLIAAGAILCCSCPPEDGKSYSYAPARCGKYNQHQPTRKIPSMYSKSEFV
ncbi:claudin-8-like [Pristis pectinata]|uniref:claudin-8-like n=1 Tax=Pristis pectinata TaxID=685728 RepID=UPI00223D130F|nr:claudin-8-like [Pristis pectinata]